MSGFYRIGKPGEDMFAHINTGRKASGQRCIFNRFEKDDARWPMCGRSSSALCDHPGCDQPMCDLHRTKHPTKPNTDFCPVHQKDADA